MGNARVRLSARKLLDFWTIKNYETFYFPPRSKPLPSGGSFPTHTVLAKDTWVSVRTKNFFMMGNAGEKDIRRVGLKLEQFREVFTRLFPNMKFNTPVPTTVVVFKSDTSYGPFKPRANTAGYFQAGPDVNYITLTTEVRGDRILFQSSFTSTHICS